MRTNEKYDVTPKYSDFDIHFLAVSISMVLDTFKDNDYGKTPSYMLVDDIDKTIYEYIHEHNWEHFRETMPHYKEED